MPEVVEGEKLVDTTPKKGWGDEDDEDDVIPPPETTFDEKTNMKTVKTYKRNEAGQLVMTQHKYLVHITRVPKAVIARREWVKFGHCAGLPKGKLESGVTDISQDDINLQLSFNAVKTEAPKEDKPLQNIECRICKKKGEHYTKNCPLASVMGSSNGPAGGDEEGADRPAAGGDEPKAGRYVLPVRRGMGTTDGEGGDGEGRDRAELPTVRVSNLSEFAGEVDLQELFKPFGPVQRVFIAKDKVTMESRGFGFVTFFNRADAARAIAKLDGYGYDHLILHLEWALPSKK